MKAAAERDLHKYKEENSRSFSQEEWNKFRRVTMIPPLAAKFVQDEFCRRALLATKDLKILECSPNPTWGIGIHLENKEEIKKALEENKLRGKNLLGHLLEEIREELKESTSHKNIPLGESKSPESQKTTPKAEGKLIKAMKEISINKEEPQIDKLISVPLVELESNLLMNSISIIYNEFDFDQHAISVRGNKVYKRHTSIKEDAVEIEEPFSRENAAKFITSSGLLRINLAIGFTWRKINRGIKSKEEFMELLGIPRPTRSLKITPDIQNNPLEGSNKTNSPLGGSNEDRKKLENSNSVEVDINQVDLEPTPDEPILSAEELEHMELELLEEDIDSEGSFPTPKNEKETKMKGNIMNIGKLAHLSLTIMLLTTLFQIGGLTPMICPKRAHSKIIHFQKGGSSCARIGSFLTQPTQQLTLDLYKPNEELFSFKAFKCLKIGQMVQYRVDFLGYEHRKPIIQTIYPISLEECQDMIRYRKCAFGSLQVNDLEQGQAHTNNPLNINPSWFKLGWDSSEAFNCFLGQIPIIGKPGTLTLESPLEDVSKCDYTQEHCKLENGAMVVWNQKEILQAVGRNPQCPFVRMTSQPGTYTKGV
uniref:NADAR domain-containing protein n=1 Tax=Meloidogyne incognita TaxID=6306 RepID=A0A914L5R6_MELIC